MLAKTEIKRKFKDAVFRRLEQYHHCRTASGSYAEYIGVCQIINLRAGLEIVGHYRMTQIGYDEALEWLDVILPERGENKD